MIPKLKHASPIAALYIEFLRELKRFGFEGDIAPDYSSRTVLSTDNSIYQVLPQGVVYPKNTEDLIRITQLASKNVFRTIVMAPRGGGTGTNAQSLTDGLVVDVSKYMNGIIEINPDQQWARVQCGVVKDQLNAALKPHGLFFAPELSTSNRATIGGMINTDASGQGSCLYGKTRDHVIELQTVLLDGSVLHTQALQEDELDAAIQQQNRAGVIYRLVDRIHRENHQLIDSVFPKLNRCLTGYDLAHIRDQQGRFNLNNILCGSEGSLGFIAEAKLRVLPIPKYSMLVVIKYSDFDSSLRDAPSLMKAGPTSIETIDSKVLNLAMNDFIWNHVEEFFAAEDRDIVQGINLVEFTGDDLRRLEHQVSAFTQMLGIDDTFSRLGYAIAKGKDAVNRLWAMRKRAVGLLGNVEGDARPVPFVEDTAVPPEHLADFIVEFREILDAYHLDYGMFGHADTGVLHVRPALDMRNPQHETIAWEISDRIADLTLQYHGLFWGEHGKGVRSEYAPQFFGELYPQLQHIKAVFDPYNQLNPGKIATPSRDIELLKIDEVPTRGQRNRFIPHTMWESFDNAVHCNGNGVCYNWNPQDAMCPSWKATRVRAYSPKGRASLIREWLKLLADNDHNVRQTLSHYDRLLGFALFPKKLFHSIVKKWGQYDFSHEVYDSMAACLACKSCTAQCPIKVDVPEFRSKFLALYHTRYTRPLKDHLVASLEALLPLLSRFPHTYNTLMENGWLQKLLKYGVGFVDAPKLTGLRLKDLPEIEFASKKILKELNSSTKSKTVVLVQDAFTSYFETQLVLDTVKLLKRLGFHPLLAPFKANGKPLHVHGFLRGFAKSARRNASMLRTIEQSGIDLVGIDPSMTLTYRSEYQHYLGKDETPAVMLLQEWLLRHIDTLRSFPSASHPCDYRLLPHCTEATNAATSVNQWRTLFAALGHNLSIMEVGCCGMSGTYGHETRNLATSKSIYDLSWRQPVERWAESNTLLATGFSCRSQIKRENGYKILHPVQALLHNITHKEVLQ